MSISCPNPPRSSIGTSYTVDGMLSYLQLSSPSLCDWTLRTDIESALMISRGRLLMGGLSQSLVLSL
jgi:hypothetical protein